MAAALHDQLISVRDSGQHGHYGSNPCVTAKVVQLGRRPRLHLCGS